MGCKAGLESASSGSDSLIGSLPTFTYSVIVKIKVNKKIKTLQGK